MSLETRKRSLEAGMRERRSEVEMQLELMQASAGRPGDRAPPGWLPGWLRGLGGRAHQPDLGLHRIGGGRLA